MEKQDRTQINAENAEIICRKLKEDAETESAGILENAAREAEAVISRAGAEAAGKAEAAIQSAEQEASLLCEKIVSSGKLEKKKAFLEEQGRFSSAVFAAVHQAADEFRGSPDYPGFLKKLISEGARVLDDTRLQVVFSPRDEALFSAEFRSEAQSACAAAAGGITLSFSAGDSGDIGVVMRTESGSRIFDGRFSPLLQQRYDEFYGKIMKEMF